MVRLRIRSGPGKAVLTLGLHSPGIAEGAARLGDCSQAGTAGLGVNAAGRQGHAAHRALHALEASDLSLVSQALGWAVLASGA